MVFAFFAAQLLGLTGVDLYFVRGILWAFGLSGAGILYWWQSRKEKAQGGAGMTAADAGATDDISVVVREAEARLAQSNVAKGARVGSLPVVFVLGPNGSAKTNTVLHSGLEAELLAGQVYQDNNVLPTRAANLWFARQNVVVEAGGGVVNNPAAWQQLVKRVDPGRMSGLGKGEQSSRAAVVCFDVEEFTKPGAADSVALAVRTLHARLSEVSQVLGISFPVYVMFTKADRVPFFLDYVRNLTNEEGTQVFGVTMPIDAGQPAGVYAEQATYKLNAVFDELFHSLADKRVDFLSREHAPDKLPGIYEYPREFRKLRASLVQFLVDLCKPSQLSAAPFLRGFYFSGVRPVVVADTPQQPVMQQQAAAAFQPGGSATGVFRAAYAQQQQAQAQAPRSGGTRRVPQWVFLTHFWNDIVLADRSATAVSTASVKNSSAKRILFATAAGLFLLYAGLLTMSYFKNRALESRVLEAAQGISATPVAVNEIPSVDALKRLDELRQEVATLTQYERDGAPLTMRFGLYVGSKLYPEVYRLYFAKFRDVLFGSQQAGMVTYLAGLPAAPQPTDAYAPPYNALKAYLLTTSEHKRPMKAFLAPYLAQRWAEGKNIDAERMALAQRQFDFYADELPAKNPYSAESDRNAVDRSREYLKKFNADERVYQALLGEAGRKAQPVNFNKMFPNPAVSDPREVRGAFTKDGWAFMQDAFKKPDKIFGGEDWVLGPQTFANLDKTQLEAKLRGFYYRDFIAEWRAFLSAASVSRYAGFGDAAKKLGVISANNSPLLALFCVVSTHTNVDAPEVKLAFQAPQAVVPPNCQTQYVMPPNQMYMGSLLKLQNLIQQVSMSAQGTNDPAAGMTSMAANDALQITGQVAQGFAIDKDGNVPATVKKLMEDPITQIDRMIKGMGPAEMKAKGAGLCGQLNGLFAKYPFNPKATAQATIEEVNQIFRPQDGALWQMYQQSLQNLVQKQGNLYVAKPGGTMRVTPQFLAFFNRAAAFAEAAYPGGAQRPQLAYTLRSDLTGSNQSVNVTLEGQGFVNAAGKASAQKFVWPGMAPGATMQVKFGGEAFNWPRYDGTWAAFEFFGDSEERGAAGSVYKLEWNLRTGQSNRSVTTATGQPVSVRFDLDMMGNPPVFRKGYFSGWGCTANVAQ
jgi:type VI secretion system protein ImpL